MSRYVYSRVRVRSIGGVIFLISKVTLLFYSLMHTTIPCSRFSLHVTTPTAPSIFATFSNLKGRKHRKRMQIFWIRFEKLQHTHHHKPTHCNWRLNCMFIKYKGHCIYTTFILHCTQLCNRTKFVVSRRYGFIFGEWIIFTFVQKCINGLSYDFDKGILDFSRA